MAQDDQRRPVYSDVPAPPFTLKQYAQSPDLMKLTNEWLHKVYQCVGENDKQLRLVEQERDRLKEECLSHKEVEKTLRERIQVLERKDGELQLTKQELKHLKLGSLRASIIQHALGLLTAISLGVGINFATSTPPNVAGWPLIFFGIGTQSISFYITYSEARKNSK